MENIKKTVMFVAVLYFQFYTGVANECIGEHQYRVHHDNCHECEMCAPGFEPTELCGYGIREPGYGCKPCDEMSFSAFTDYRLCKTCQPCKTWNSEIREACTSTLDAVCGDCFPNHFRLRKSDGSYDQECEKCVPSSTLAECNRAVLDWWVFFLIAIGAALLTAIVMGSCFHKKCSTVKSKPIESMKEPSQSSCIEASFKEPFLKPIVRDKSLTCPIKATPDNEISLPTYSVVSTVLYKTNLERSIDDHDRPAEEDVFSIKVDAFDTDSITDPKQKV